MENTFITINSNSDVNELVKQVNKIRLANKNRWYQIRLENETTGHITYLKIYNTWIQLTKPSNAPFGSQMDMSIKEFKEEIARGLTKIVNNF